MRCNTRVVSCQRHDIAEREKREKHAVPKSTKSKSLSVPKRFRILLSDCAEDVIVAKSASGSHFVGPR